MDWYIVYIVSVILIIPCLILGSISTTKVSTTFDKYSKILSRKGINSCELAQKIMNYAGIDDVDIAEINGKLTDCYDSKHKVVKLSSATIRSTSVAALGVTAHELGHAIQDHKKTFMFRLRRVLVPTFNFFSRAFVPLLVIGTLLSFVFYIPNVGDIVCWISVGMYAMSLIFHLITLPLEFDASKRALKLLEELEILERDELDGAKAVLRAAIYTYISALAVSLVYFLKALGFAMMIAGDRKD